MRYDPARLIMVDRQIGVTKINGNDRNASSFCSINIGAAIPNHNSPVLIATSLFDCLCQMPRIRLSKRKTICATNCSKTLIFAHGFEKPEGERFKLVGANRQNVSIGGKTIHSFQYTWKKARLSGHVFCIIGSEFFDQMIQSNLINLLLLRRECTLYHYFAAMPDKATKRGGVSLF